MKNLKLEQKKEIQNLTAKLELMKKLSTSLGFYRFYFMNLKNYKTVNDCFNAVNKLYFDLFGVERFASYNHFRVMTKINSLQN